MLRERCMSTLLHIVNKHRWRGHCLFQKCGYLAITRRDENSIEWLKPGSPAHVALEEVVTKKKRYCKTHRVSSHW